MLHNAFAAPLQSSESRDSLAICSGLIIVCFLLLRVIRSLYPELIVFIPAAIMIVAASLFIGYLGWYLQSRPETDTRPTVSTETAVLGARLLTVGGVYTIPAAVAVSITAYTIVSGARGFLITLGPTVALLATVASVYLLPAALHVAATSGVRPALTRHAVSGLASGSYFFSWVVATTLIVSSWSLQGAISLSTPAAIIGAVIIAYTHLVAVQLLSEGLSRSRHSLS